MSSGRPEASYWSQIVGANCRRLRGLHDLSQVDLGVKIGCGDQAIGFIERGNREVTASELVAMADIFQVSIETLFTQRDLLGAIRGDERKAPIVDLASVMNWAET